MLEPSKDEGQASAATDAIRALCLNNSSNKDAVREAWALPLLVKLLSSVSVCDPFAVYHRATYLLSATLKSDASAQREVFHCL